jgi:hypothetical protein
VFLLQSQDVKFNSSKSEVEYFGRKYTKLATFAVENLNQALVESRKQIENEIACLVIQDPAGITVWVLKREIAFKLSIQTQAELTKILIDMVGPMGKILLERTLPNAKSSENLVDLLTQKLPSTEQKKFKVSAYKCLGV